MAETGLSNEYSPTVVGIRASDEIMPRQFLMMTYNTLAEYSICFNRSDTISADGHVCQRCKPWTQEQRIEFVRIMVVASRMLRLVDIFMIFTDMSGVTTGIGKFVE